MTDAMKEQVLGWVDSMRDFDWCSSFQDSLDELARIVGSEPKDSDRPDYRPPRASPHPGPAHENPNIVWGCRHG